MATQPLTNSIESFGAAISFIYKLIIFIVWPVQELNTLELMPLFTYITTLK